MYIYSAGQPAQKEPVDNTPTKTFPISAFIDDEKLEPAQLKPHSGAFSDISVSEAKVGDTSGVWTITDVQLKDNPGYTHSSIAASFAGQVTIEGMVEYNDMIGAVCFDVNEYSAEQIPRFLEDGRRPWFCFRDDSVGKAKEIQTKWEKKFEEAQDYTTIPAVITISNYKVNFFPKEISDWATLVAVVE